LGFIDDLTLPTPTQCGSVVLASRVGFTGRPFDYDDGSLPAALSRVAGRSADLI
jgi:hypothetical protein